MCGIAAVVAPRLGSNARTALVGELTCALSHRGPDSSGYVDVGPVALGHTRLRVVDPRPEADQPVSHAGKHLVFSGAIVNHRELRAELERDHRVELRTTSDTEVLLHCLLVFGLRALDRLKGMFAFVLHDAERGRVIAARDRVGIKPLVWTRRADGAVLLASEAQALLRAGGIARDVDPTALRQILRFNHPLGDRTFVGSVRSLEPGCALEIDLDDGEPRVRRWWSASLAPRAMRLDEAAEELDASFRRAVARAADVDVRLGCYLSGGVDSTGIAAEVAEQGRNARLYSLVLPGVRYSEEHHVDTAAEHLGGTVEKVAVRGLGLDDWIEYALRAEMPQWWTSDLALGVLARAAKRRGTTVVLSGEGPDELFAGYDVYRVAPVRPLLAATGRLFGGALERGGVLAPVVKRIVPWLDMDTSVARAYLASHDPRRSHAIAEHFGFHPENLALWEALDARRPLSGRLGSARAIADYRASERASFARIGLGAEGLTSLERNLHFEITQRLPRWILHMGDRMSSTHGVELRFPYLDDDFFTSALTVPTRLRATMLEDKRVLRRMHRRRLPRAIARRPKQPLYTPTREWIGPVLADPRLGRYWSRPAFERAGLLDFEVCDEARLRLTRPPSDALTAMTDEWLFSFALTCSILAVDLCGA